jgi:DNA invertase Pin-like site-specific DNA recombinase
LFYPLLKCPDGDYRLFPALARKWPPEDDHALRRQGETFFQQGVSKQAIAQKLGISRTSVRRILDK